MNIYLLTLSLLIFALSINAQDCSADYSIDCEACLADANGYGNCVACDLGGVVSCASDSCLVGSPVTTCPVNCAQVGIDGGCAACLSAGCAPCELSGFLSCFNDNATCTLSTGTPRGDCSPSCQPLPSPGPSNPTCTFPVGHMLNAAYDAMFIGCQQINEANVTGFNCSNECDMWISENLACGQAFQDYSCNSLCGNCDPGVGLGAFSDYLPCQSFCDGIVTACTGAPAGCFNTSVFMCSDDSARCGNGATGDISGAGSCSSPSPAPTPAAPSPAPTPAAPSPAPTPGAPSPTPAPGTPTPAPSTPTPSPSGSSTNGAFEMVVALIFIVVASLL